jgi:hypothetical protein
MFPWCNVDFIAAILGTLVETPFELEIRHGVSFHRLTKALAAFVQDLLTAYQDFAYYRNDEDCGFAWD